jgi:transposase
VADSALSSTENLQTLAKTGRPWIPRVPATITEAQDALAHADPETMEPLGEGYRYPMLASTYGGVPQRWMLCDSAQRRPQAQHSVDQPWRQQSEAAAQAFQTLCRTPFACEADAQQALATFAHGVQAASLYEGTLQPRRRYGKRGRPGQDALPPQGVSHLTGALTSSLAAHEALVAPQSCLILAINELDEPLGLPPELLAGSKGQAHAERGFGS